jgi:hypothetical protein
MGAAADCEAIGAGFLGQPVNTLTTLAFIVAGGLVMVRRRELSWVGVALIATGIGSFLFHGPMPRGSEWAHDVTLAWLLALITITGGRWARLAPIPVLVALGVGFWLFPEAGDPVAVLLTVLAVIALLARDHSASTLGPLALLAAAAVFGRLGSTVGPLCDPNSVLQPHGVWHVGAAVAVAWWAIGSPMPQSSTSR